MAKVVLVGTLKDGIIGMGGETTGFAIAIGEIEVDASKVENAKGFVGKSVIVAGDLVEEHLPTLRNLPVVLAHAIATSFTGLSKTALRSTTFLSGTFVDQVARPGGEGPYTALTGVSAEADVSGVPYQALVGKSVSAEGTFEIVRGVEIKERFVFKVARLTAATARGAGSK
jgi:hypothetical protein